MFMQRNVAYLLLITMLGLIAIGLVMLSSTSSVLAPVDMMGVYSNLRKQCMWLGLGGIACVFLSRYDYQKLLRYAPWAVGLACLLLVLCLVPHVGVKINGSPRWLRLGGWTYQPSEFAKLALIFFLSWWMGKNQRHVHEFLKGFFLPIICTVPILALMVKQEDFGTTAIMLAILVAIMFCAGTRMIYLIPVPILGFAGLVMITLLKPERMARWMAFLHPEHSSDPKGWQQLQALIALGSGGLSGLGLGNSRQKMYWLPEVNTDFVFPIIGEELGMWVTLGIVLAFLLLMLCSGWITVHAPDPAGVLLGTGITLMIALQAMMNLAVVTSLMPCKGIALPFISYGGSNLLTCLAAIGILFNMHRQGVYQVPRTPTLVPKPYSVRM
ncbi:MAG TPA: putative lipid II flippase FtsW [Candidatus Methylacidiphilales bacterium]